MLSAMVTNESHHSKHHYLQSNTSVPKQVSSEKSNVPAPEVAYVPAQFHHQKAMSTEEKVFKVIDVDSDGQISYGELLTVMRRAGLADEMASAAALTLLGQADADYSATISVDEFVHIIHTDKVIFILLCNHIFAIGLQIWNVLKCSIPHRQD